MQKATSLVYLAHCDALYYSTKTARDVGRCNVLKTSGVLTLWLCRCQYMASQHITASASTFVRCVSKDSRAANVLANHYVASEARRVRGLCRRAVEM